MSAAGQRASLVTGGTDGIGRAVALGLARGGDRVLFVGRSVEKGARVLVELREAGPGTDHAFFPADLSILPRVARALGPVLLRLMASPPKTAAHTPVFLAQDTGAKGIGGRFYGPKIKERAVSARASRPERRGELWAGSEEPVRPCLTQNEAGSKGATK